MIQGRRGLRLEFETPQAFKILRNRGGQDLDCHFPFQNRVESAIYLAHSSRTEEAEYFISVQLCACGQRHREADYISRAQVIRRMHSKAVRRRQGCYAINSPNQEIEP